jgi:hypothetical protein
LELITFMPLLMRLMLKWPRCVVLTIARQSDERDNICVVPVDFFVGGRKQAQSARERERCDEWILDA